MHFTPIPRGPTPRPDIILFLSQPLQIKVACRCGRWEFREIAAMAGALAPFAVPLRCPRCKADALLVFRVGFGQQIYLRHLGTVYPRGRNEGDLITALDSVSGLTDDERELMITTARLWAVPAEVGV